MRWMEPASSSSPARPPCPGRWLWRPAWPTRPARGRQRTTDTSSISVHRQPAPGSSSEVKVVIVGAGVMGCSLAFHLARTGLRDIVVLDRGEIGRVATLACAGGVRAQFSTEINIRIGIEAKRTLKAFEAETGRSADFREVGYLFLLATDEERWAFQASVQLQRRLGVEDVRWLTPAEAGNLVFGLDTSDLAGAVFCPS